MTQQTQFGAVLAEAMAELEQSDGLFLPSDDPIERLSFAAHQAILAQPGTSTVKPGARIYLEDVPVIATPEGQQLDVKF